MRYRFSQSAELDVWSVTRFYIQERRELAVDFIEELHRVLSLVQENQQIGQRVGAVYRRIPLRRFPYVLHYRIDEDASLIRIVAVSHQKRRPGHWADRVEEPVPLYLAA
jgi:toxin ParE1/3/4